MIDEVERAAVIVIPVVDVEETFTKRMVKKFRKRDSEITLFVVGSICSSKCISILNVVKLSDTQGVSCANNKTSEGVHIRDRAP